MNLALTIAGQVINLSQAVDPPLAFYTLAPCRIADTRTGDGFTGAFGPPSLVGGATRNFPFRPAVAMCQAMRKLILSTSLRCRMAH
jgi:hypothetical protein